MTTTTTDYGGERAAFNRRLNSLEEEVVLLKEHLERAETVAAIREGQAQIDGGEGVPAQDAFEILKNKYNLHQR